VITLSADLAARSAASFFWYSASLAWAAFELPLSAVTGHVVRVLDRVGVTPGSIGWPRRRMRAWCR
jgi:hypothetical protein